MLNNALLRFTNSDYLFGVFKHYLKRAYFLSCANFDIIKLFFHYG